MLLYALVPKERKKEVICLGRCIYVSASAALICTRRLHGCIMERRKPLVVVWYTGM